MAPHIECLAWRSCERNTLKGFADFYISAVGLTVKDCAVHQKGGGAWVQLPAKPRLDADRNLIRNPQTGRPEYVKILNFEDKTYVDAFRDAAIMALKKKAPGAVTVEVSEECPPLFI